jgi:hypothetical protein
VHFLRYILKKKQYEELENQQQKATKVSPVLTLNVSENSLEAVKKQLSGRKFEDLTLDGKSATRLNIFKDSPLQLVLKTPTVQTTALELEERGSSTKIHVQAKLRKPALFDHHKLVVVQSEVKQKNLDLEVLHEQLLKAQGVRKTIYFKLQCARIIHFLTMLAVFEICSNVSSGSYKTLAVENVHQRMEAVMPTFITMTKEYLFILQGYWKIGAFDIPAVRFHNSSTSSIDDSFQFDRMLITLSEEFNSCPLVDLNESLPRFRNSEIFIYAPGIEDLDYRYISVAPANAFQSINRGDYSPELGIETVVFKSIAGNSYCMKPYRVAQSNASIVSPWFLGSKQASIEMQEATVCRTLNAMSWYEGARTATGFSFPSSWLYQYEPSLRGVMGFSVTYTLRQDMDDPTSPILAIFGITMNIFDLTKHVLAPAAKSNLAPDSVIFLTTDVPEQGFRLVATSTGQYPAFSSPLSMFANNTPPLIPSRGSGIVDFAIARAASFMTQDVLVHPNADDHSISFGHNYSEVPPEGFLLQRRYMDPNTTVWHSKEMNWMSVACIPLESDFFMRIDSTTEFALYISTYILILTGYLLLSVASVHQFHDYDEDNPFSHILRKEDTGEYSKQDLEKLVENIRGYLLKGLAVSGLAKFASPNGSNCEPVRLNHLRKLCLEEALSHIKNLGNRRNLLSMCHLSAMRLDDNSEMEKLMQKSRCRQCCGGALFGMEWKAWPFRIYKIATNPFFGGLIYWSIFTHILCLFLEPTPAESGVSREVIALKSFCIFIEIVDVVINFFLIYRWDKPNILRPVNPVVTDVLFAALVAWEMFDFILQGTTGQSFAFKFPVRSFLLVLKSPSIRNTAYHFLLTLKSAYDVMLTYVLLILAISSAGLAVFPSALNSEYVNSSTTNIVRSVITFFTYIATIDNYDEVVYAALSKNPAFAIFLFSSLIFCFYLVLAVVISVFQRGFKQMRQANEISERANNQIGLLAAFVMLDVDGNGYIDQDNFFEFIFRLLPNTGGVSMNKLVTLHASLDSDGDCQIDVKEFVDGVSGLTFSKLTRTLDDKNLRVFHELREQVAAFYESETYRLIMVALIFINFSMTSLYGISDFEVYLDHVLVIFMWFYLIEITVKVCVYGWEDYWYFDDFREDESAVFRRKQHRSDVVMFALIWCYYIYIHQVTANFMNFSEEESSYRIVFALPLFRWPLYFEGPKKIIWGIFGLLSRIINVFALMMIVFMVYALFGVSLLQYKLIPVLQNEAPPGNFDSVMNAYFALFQLLTTANWSDVMFAAVDVTRSFSICGYFISFIALMSIIFSNLFTGIVLDEFDMLLSRDEEFLAEKAKRAKEKEIAAQHQRALKAQKARDEQDTAASERTKSKRPLSRRNNIAGPAINRTPRAKSMDSALS